MIRPKQIAPVILTCARRLDYVLAFTRSWRDLDSQDRIFVHSPIIAIENRPFKQRIGLDPQTKFFSPADLSANQGLNALLMEFSQARQADPQARPTRDRMILHANRSRTSVTIQLTK